MRLKFGGRCAYCGCRLGDRWHADHMEPVIRGDWLGLPAERPENHNLANMMPACPPCNISKASMGLETWRGWIEGHVRSLNLHHPIYRMVKAYGLVTENLKPVRFYFEQAERKDEAA